MDKLNNTAIKFFFVAILLLLLLPMINYQLKFIKELRLYGSETQALQPIRSFKSYFKGQYQDSFAHYFSEHLPLRSYAIKTHNQILFSAFKYTNASQVVIGKESYLYETPYLNAFTGLNYIGDSAINIRAIKLQKLQLALAKINKKLLVVFAPGKASYFPEAMPNEYQQKINKNNHDEFVKAYQKKQINYIDFVTYFNKLKQTSPYPLYGKYGIHWSQYGMNIALDSMLHKMELDANQKFPSRINLETAVTNDYRFTDNDVELALNLFVDLPKENMAYRSFQFEKNTNKYKPNIIVVADSYWWLAHNNYISKEIFKEYHFLYYNKSIYDFDQELPLTPNDDLIADYLNRADIIVLMATEANHNWFPYGFDDQLLNILNRPRQNQEFSEEAIQLKINEIKADANWFHAVREKAKANRVKLIQQLRADAIWVLAHP
jgi:hypothetical protein